MLQAAWDGVSGRELDQSKVRKASGGEVAYIHKTNLCTKVPRQKAIGLGAKIITVRLIDINNGNASVENYRSRLVARESKKDVKPDLLAATPTLEALQAIISLCVSGNK